MKSKEWKPFKLTVKERAKGKPVTITSILDKGEIRVIEYETGISHGRVEFDMTHPQSEALYQKFLKIVERR